ncbi:helix-turn-helix domain-containing protein [Planococcus plakortidis]
MTIGSNIKAIRKERKLKQGELAKSMGISRSYLSDIENDRKNPSIKTLESLAEKLNVTVFYLTSGNKMLSDLTDEDLKTAGMNFQNFISEAKLDSQDYVVKTFENLMNSNLDYIETAYLVNVLDYLIGSSKEDISFLSSFVRSINNLTGEGSEEVKVSQEDVDGFIEETLQDMQQFLHKRFDLKGGK